jgi:hypothetical protein
MKKTLVLSILVASVAGALGQGQLTFQNRVVGSVISPIYGVNPAAPAVRISGNTATGTPMGSANYGTSPLLAGTGFTAQLWVGPAGSDMAALVLASGGSTTSFRTGSGAGFVVQPASSAVVDGVPGGSGSRAAFQIRAWDNMGGTVTSWAMALANPIQIASGFSEVVQGTFDLGGGPILPNAGLPGVTSFNLVQVPEPSLIALGALGLGALLLRRRK